MKALAAAAALVVLLGCSNDDPSAQPAESPAAGVANPASEFCESNGGREENREDPEGGQSGICVFPDGSECESFAFMRGDCEPGDSLGSGGGNTSSAARLCSRLLDAWGSGNRELASSLADEEVVEELFSTPYQAATDRPVGGEPPDCFLRTREHVADVTLSETDGAWRGTKAVVHEAEEFFSDPSREARFNAGS